PAAAGGRLYVPSHDGHVYGLRADSLETVWSVPVSSITDIESPIVANGQFYLYSGGSLSAFRAVNEYRLWTASWSQLSDNAPVVANGVVYQIDDPEGTVYAFATSCDDPCDPLWSASVGEGGVLRSLVV